MAPADAQYTIHGSATDEDGTYSADNGLDISVVSTPADVTAPTLVLTAANVSTAGGTSYTFTIVFTDSQGILVADLNDSDVAAVIAPSVFSTNSARDLRKLLAGQAA